MNEATMAQARTGALNLLQACMGVAPGDRILVVKSDGADDYDPDVAAFVSSVAEDVGCHAKMYLAPAVDGPEHFPDDVAEAMQDVDHTVFFSRIGDQFRFCETPGHCTKTMTYALSLDLLGSEFGRVPHGLMVAVLDRLNDHISAGGVWRITCPLGTDLKVTSAPFAPDDPDGDFTVELFPIGVFRPLGASDMIGCLATRWISPTLNRVYEPGGFVLDEPVMMEIGDGRISGFAGPHAARVESHYDYVASLFDIDARNVHSWHAGIHPKTWYDRPSVDSLTRWGSVAFNSPRYTHFHTCGDYPPGEISPVLIDATITFEGKPLWQDGGFVFLDRPDMAAIPGRFSAAADAFEQCWEIGL